jgi:hypothetical protein
MIIATQKDMQAAKILTTLKHHNLVLLKELNKYGIIMTSGHGFYTIKVIDGEGEEDIIKCRGKQFIFI